MPDITVRLTDGRTVRFPDGTSQQEMEQALAQLPPLDTPQPSTDGEKSIGGFLGNVVSSGAGAIENTVNTLLHPIEAIKAAHAQKVAWDAQPINEPVVYARPGQRLLAQLGQAGEEVYQDPVGMALAFTGGGAAKIPTAPLKGPLVRAGVRTMRGAIKPNTGDLNKMAGSTQAGLDAMSERVAQTTLRERVNPMTGRGLETIQRRVDALNDQRDTMIAGAPQQPVEGSGVRQLRSLRPVQRKYGPQSQTFSERDVAEIRGLRGEMRRNPELTKSTDREVPREAHLVDEPFMGGNAPSSVGNTASGTPTETVKGPRRMRDLSPNELNRMNKGDNAALRDKFGKVGNAEIDARKAVVGSRRDMLEESVPGTKAIGKRLSELIDLRNVANVARKRGEGRDLLGLTDLIALTSQRPAALLATTAMRPAAQAGVAGMLYRTGQALPETVNLGPLLKAALLAELLKGSQEQ